MMNWSDGNIMAVQAHQRELRAWAEQERLVRQARHTRARPALHRWRRRIGKALIAAGEALTAAAPDPAC